MNKCIRRVYKITNERESENARSVFHGLSNRYIIIKKNECKNRYIIIKKTNAKLPLEIVFEKFIQFE